MARYRVELHFEWGDEIEVEADSHHQAEQKGRDHIEEEMGSTAFAHTEATPTRIDDSD